jgi:hypothetical protein
MDVSSWHPPVPEEGHLPAEQDRAELHAPRDAQSFPGPGPRQPVTDAQPGGAPSFEELMAEVMASARRFGHREHVHLTWLTVRRCGVSAAIGVISDGIQRTARYAGAPQKYHATVSRAWVELVGHHALESGEADFTAFAGRHPALLDKRLLTRFYRPATLATPQAKSDWVEPDLAPFPWQLPGPQFSSRVAASTRRGRPRVVTASGAVVVDGAQSLVPA